MYSWPRLALPPVTLHWVAVLTQALKYTQCHSPMRSRSAARPESGETDDPAGSSSSPGSSSHMMMVFGRIGVIMVIGVIRLIVVIGVNVLMGMIMIRVI